MTLKNNEKQNANKNAKHLIGSSNKIKRARIFIGLVNEDANNVISQWNFLEGFTLTSFEMQLCDWAIELFTAHIRSLLGGDKEKLCFNLAKHWFVKQIANTLSRSYESRSIAFKPGPECSKHG